MTFRTVEMSRMKKENDKTSVSYFQTSVLKPSLSQLYNEILKVKDLGLYHLCDYILAQFVT